MDGRNGSQTTNGSFWTWEQVTVATRVPSLEVHPNWFIIGVDACRENLREHSQTKLQNLLFIIAKHRNYHVNWTV